MKTTKIQVFLNLNDMAMVRGYVDGDFLEDNWTCMVRVEDQGFNPNDLCGAVFAMTQQGSQSGATVYGRSMTVGDVIEVTFAGKVYLYACTDRGWDWINNLDQ